MIQEVYGFFFKICYVYKINKLFIVALKHNNIFSFYLSLFYWRHVSAFPTVIWPSYRTLRYMQLCSVGLHVS